MAIERVARRYARALFEVSLERGQEDAVLATLQELQQLWNSMPELRHALGNPSVPAEKKVAVLQQVVGEAAPEPIRRFMAVIVRHVRVEVLRYAADLMTEMIDEVRGVRHATVTAALPLTTGQVTGLREALREAMGCTVILEQQVDPDLIGGVAVRIGDLVMDGSIRQRLNSLRRHLERERELRSEAAS